MIWINKDDMTEVGCALGLIERVVDNQNTILFNPQSDAGFLQVSWENKADDVQLREEEIDGLLRELMSWVEEQHHQISLLRARIHESWWWRRYRQKKLARLARAVVGPERVLAKLKAAR